MTLTAHAIVGAAIAAAMPSHPVLGVCAAFASHFLIDAIPHWDYPIRSSSVDPTIGAPMRFDRALLLDLFSIGGDFVLGMLLGTVFFATPTTLPLIAAAALAGTLPDALQFAYILFPRQLDLLQRFHQWIHTRHRFREHPVLGIASQIIFIIAFVVLARTFLHL